MEIKSKAQARFLGWKGFGKGSGKVQGPTPAKARKMMRENKGFKMRELPERAPQARSKSRRSR